MIHHNLEYNSQKEDLVISEYGRNVQNLIQHCKTIENDEERQAFAEAIIDLMYQMNPNNRNNPDYKEKLWRHFFRIAEFDIKVAPPNGEIPTPKSSKLKPHIVPYPKWDKNYRHYGNHVKAMIQKAIIMEDKEKQIEFAETIGAYMKLAFRTWSREHFVSDEIVREDLKKLSKGVLDLSDDTALDMLSSKLKKRSKVNNNQNRSRRSNKGNNNNRRRRR
jgi:hypothetical protein